MASEMEMSLEEIIKKKRIPSRKPVSRPFEGGKPMPSQRKFHVQNGTQGIDARNKIILKKRNQITDARDKLAELAKKKDARLKLEQLRLRKAALSHTLGRNSAYYKVQENQGRLRRVPAHLIDRVFTDASRYVKSQPLVAPPKFNINRQIGYSKKTPAPRFMSRDIQGFRNVPVKPILRTVENDIIVPRPILIDEDFDNPPPARATRSLAGRQTTLNLKIIARNEIARERAGGILRKSVDREKDKSPPLPPSILKKRPMASLRSERTKVEKPDSNESAEYRIIVSNLRNTVTGSDIQELFGDVGSLSESRLVRPGTAEVIYRTLGDAQRAVELYHNRQLDGQPMNCLLVNPRSPSSTLRSSSGSKSHLPASTSSSVVPDISTFHKVLFSGR